MHIAFIGVGNMGRPMLANLLKQGFSATAYDIVPAALDGAVALGAARASSPAEAAATGDMVITILPSSGNVEAAYLGAGGILEGVAPGKLCIDMSTVDPGTSQRIAARLAEQGIRFIGAPVSGGVGGATAGALAIMVGGAPADFAEAKPALEAMGANIIHVGDTGAGEVAKLCNNLIAGVAFVAVSEAFRIAEGYGVDLKSADSGDRQILGRDLGHGEEPPGPRHRPQQRRQPRLCPRLHDRSDGQGSRPRGQCRARQAGAGVGRRRGAADLSHGLGARPRPQGLRRGLPLPGTLEGRGAGVTEGRRPGPIE
jgi:3-hydroxyisobutyrate dehydrogenase-like beta-hydroxyacid dehydrogenase